MTLIDRLLVWEKNEPEDLFGDPLWRLPAFRLGRFLSVIVREDLDHIGRRHELHGPAHQLLRAVDSISTNIAEGYARFSGRDRGRLFEIALGSAREAREWYWRLRSELGEAAALERAQLLTRVIKILTVAVPQERAGASERRMQKRGRMPKERS
jgi:four helix bundle protein